MKTDYIDNAGDGNNDSDNQACYIFDSHADAEQAIRSLGKAGFDLKKLSLVGSGFHSEEKPLGFYTIGDKIKAWGSAGAFWGSIWGLLLAPAVFFLPGIGLMAMAGPIVAGIVSALEGAVIVGGFSALGAALTEIGVSKDQVIKYETALKVKKYLLMVHGSAQDRAKAQLTLGNSKMQAYPEPSAALNTY